MHLFVCFVCVGFCHFSLPLGVGGWLRFVIVALLDFSINFFIYGNIGIFFMFASRSVQVPITESYSI